MVIGRLVWHVSAYHAWKSRGNEGGEHKRGGTSASFPLCMFVSVPPHLPAR
jgi:hypothetical protein